MGADGKNLEELTSLPAWERGLKYLSKVTLMTESLVAPSMGAWIEMIQVMGAQIRGPWVAPSMGAWIEIFESLDTRC